MLKDFIIKFLAEVFRVGLAHLALMATPASFHILDPSSILSLLGGSIGHVTNIVGVTASRFPGGEEKITPCGLTTVEDVITPAGTHSFMRDPNHGRFSSFPA